MCVMAIIVRFVPQGRIGPFFNSSFPIKPKDSIKGSQSYYPFQIESFNLKDKEMKDKDKLVGIVNSRFKDRFSDKIKLTTVFGDPDFLPFSFLTLGVYRGSAVCRLLENFEGYERAAELAGIVENAGKARRKPYTITELCEIFSIEDSSSFFRDFDDATAYEALKKPESIKQIMPIPSGTGFLVGPNYLLTAQHVINSSGDLKTFIAEFNYEKDIYGCEKKVVRYELDPNFYVSNKELDYVLVKLKDIPLNEDFKAEKAGDYFGWIPLLKDDKLIAPPLKLSEIQESQLEPFPELKLRLQRPDSAGDVSGLPGEPVSIIQHPKGRFKEIVLSNNRVQGISDNFLYYEADADFSSSGSPVFNAQWQLVALHHAYISEQTDDRLYILGYEGTRIFRIIDDLEKQARESLQGALKEEVSNFIQKFVDLDFDGQISRSLGEYCKSLEKSEESEM
jgi:V8-like Glu-specific endopeptidase